MEGLLRGHWAPGLEEARRFATLLARKENEDELDRLVAGWRAEQTAEDVMGLVQKAGISAGVVSDFEDLWNDPQLRDRRHFLPVPHREIGEHNVDAFSFKLSKTPAEVRLGAPCLGEHNQHVCTGLLGMSDIESLLSY